MDDYCLFFSYPMKQDSTNSLDLLQCLHEQSYHTLVTEHVLDKDLMCAAVRHIRPRRVLVAQSGWVSSRLTLDSAR